MSSLIKRDRGIHCPWILLAPLYIYHHLHRAPVKGTSRRAVLYECTPKTLVAELTSSVFPGTDVIRFERFQFLGDKKLLDRFDVIYAATKKDKESAEIMLEMLANSVINSS